jgi:hypothetical protein
LRGLLKPECAAVKNYQHDISPPDYLEGDMTCRDVVEILKQIKFSKPGDMHCIEIDKTIRDFIVAKLTPPRRRA